MLQLNYALNVMKYPAPVCQPDRRAPLTNRMVIDHASPHEGWIATREHPDDQTLFEVLYDSAPGARQRPETRHGGSTPPLIDAIDHRLALLGLLPGSSLDSPPAIRASRGRRSLSAPAAAPVKAGTCGPPPAASSTSPSGSLPCPRTRRP
ncbi:hypothetical protein M2266_001045 [Streptomyces sp. SPB162]|nr:hypothetical protein [Streptomyces sp. SPB162]